MTANAPLLVIHPLFGDQQNGSHGHQHAADHIEKGSADAAGGGQGRTFIVSYVNAYTRLYVIVYRCGYTCAIITGITISGGDFEPYRSSQAVIARGCFCFIKIIHCGVIQTINGDIARRNNIHHRTVVTSRSNCVGTVAVFDKANQVFSIVRLSIITNRA